MASLDAAILGSRSATATLEAWCASHAMAETPRIVALRIAGPEQPPSDEQRARLEVGPGEPVRHRRVRLACGTRVLSEADNWYVPSRLTPEMNAALETTDTPYGKVVAPLAPVRRTFAAEVLWPVLPAGWELHPPRDDHPERRLDVPRVLFEHRALLIDRAGHPISEVDEHYLAAVLAFAPRR